MSDARPHATAGDTPETPASRFAAAVFDTFERAHRLTGVEDRHVAIGQDTVRLRFASAAMRAVVGPAFAHLRPHAMPRDPTLTICVGDSASTGLTLPSPPWTLDDYVNRGEVQYGVDDGLRIAFHTEGSILTLYEVAGGRALYWARDAAGVPYYESGSPCRSVLGWWNVSRGRQLVHAGAVGTADGCVLLAGRGGSGKSNTAIRCLVDGLSYLSDDYCLVSPGVVPIAHSVYCSGKMHGHDLTRFPELRGHVVNRGGLPHEKALFFFERILPDRLLAQAPIRAVIVPHLAQTSTSTLTPLSPRESLLALAPSTTAQLPHAGAEVMRAIVSLVRSVPSYRLTIGGDGRDAPALVSRYLDTTVVAHA